jgi:hypothetical protein
VGRGGHVVGCPRRNCVDNALAGRRAGSAITDSYVVPDMPKVNWVQS